MVNHSNFNAAGIIRVFFVALLSAIISGCDITDSRPNILLILADDMALSDLGSFGGEIETPNLDTLAMRGVRLANFHTSPLCAPTRAMLLSGTDHHLAGMGAMREVANAILGKEGYQALTQNPGYEGFLAADVETLPEVLKSAGYHTHMTGKWHLGSADDQTPQHHGFDRSFALLEGGAGHFSELAAVKGYGPTYREDGIKTHLPEDFYSTRFYTEKMIEYIESTRDDGQPFFAYLAYTAPHWPLQASRETIEKYKNRYDEGYDVLLAQRLKGLNDQGILQAGAETESFPRITGEPAWEELSETEKVISSRTMAIHAAMVDDVDNHVGKLLDYLREIGELDNTFIVFMSDNGVDGKDIGSQGYMRGWTDECCNNELENLGNADSYAWLGQNWGRALSAPHRMYKGYVSEGGTHTLAFVTPPAYESQGRIEHAYVTAMDIMPTLLDAVGIDIPQGSYKGREMQKVLGHSILNLVLGGSSATQAEQQGSGMELHGNMSYRKGEYKILKQRDQLSTGDFQLYHLPSDPAEIHDLSESMPELRDELINDYRAYVDTAGIVPWQKYRKNKIERTSGAKK